uniref:C-type lectin domain-containing protein n=1 Tax=Astyanax mexicanus TaxID=7994 RepID=A0A3B1KCA5_ASTMX
MIIALPIGRKLHLKISGINNVELTVLLSLQVSGGPSSARLRYYYLVTEPKTWVQAQSYCRQKYTDLATVDSMAEMEELKGFIPPGFSDSIWIGLKRGPMRPRGWSSGEVLHESSNKPQEETRCFALCTYSYILTTWQCPCVKEKPPVFPV